jgi:hypothetical protein
MRHGGFSWSSGSRKRASVLMEYRGIQSLSVSLEMLMEILGINEMGLWNDVCSKGVHGVLFVQLLFCKEPSFLEVFYDAFLFGCSMQIQACHFDVTDLL